MAILTRQEIFDKVWDTFVFQRSPRSADMDGCKYFFKGTRGCAVGCLLPEDVARKWDTYITSNIEDIYIKHPQEFKTFFNPNDVEFLLYLQNIHDDPRVIDEIFPLHMKQWLLEFAKEYHLVVPND